LDLLGDLDATLVQPVAKPALQAFNSSQPETSKPHTSPGDGFDFLASGGLVSEPPLAAHSTTAPAILDLFGPSTQTLQPALGAFPIDANANAKPAYDPFAVLAVAPAQVRPPLDDFFAAPPVAAAPSTIGTQGMTNSFSNSGAGSFSKSGPMSAPSPTPKNKDPFAGLGF
jgi:hypothetical protein